MFIKRPVTSFRLREDFAERVSIECARLGCSKGVYIEIRLAKAWDQGLITSADVFAYDPTLRWVEPSGARRLKSYLQMSKDLAAILDSASQAYYENNFALASAECHNILRSHPEIYSALNILAVIQRRQGNAIDAGALAKAAIYVDSSRSDAYNTLGNVLSGSGNYGDAIELFSKALSIAPANLAARLNLANAHFHLGNAGEAIKSYRQLISDGYQSAAIHANLATMLMREGSLSAAYRNSRQALEMNPSDPKVRFGYSQILHAQGNYTEAWKYYESRFDAEPDLVWVAESAAQIWNGESLEGKSILIQEEQGFGDVIQFSRFINIVAEQAAMVFFDLRRHHSLIPLLRSTLADNVSILQKGEVDPVVDYCIPLMSLAGRFDVDVDDVPCSAIPYLTAPATSDDILYSFPKTGSARIGVVWNANRLENPSAKLSSAARSIPLEKFSELFSAPNLAFFSLQKDTTRAEIDILNAFEVDDFGPRLRDFGVTADVINGLDLVITVDTSVAHVAAAMGVPTWVLVPYATDWRWLSGNSESPWYSSVRLFRQPGPGRWTDVIQEVGEALSSVFLREESKVAKDSSRS